MDRVIIARFEKTTLRARKLARRFSETKRRGLYAPFVDAAIRAEVLISEDGELSDDAIVELLEAEGTVR